MNINATLFGQMITFAIFVWFTLKVVWPMLESTLKERKQKIADGLAAAEKGEHTLKQAEHKVKEELKTARLKSSEIIEEANKQAAMIIEEAKEKAHHEKKDIIDSGHKHIQQEFHRIKSDLKTQISSLVVFGVQQILEKRIDEQDHKDILDKIVEQV